MGGLSRCNAKAYNPSLLARHGWHISEQEGGQIVNTKSEVSRVEGSAHFPYFEKPEEFDRIVVGFIGRNA